MMDNIFINSPLRNLNSTRTGYLLLFREPVEVYVEIIQTLSPILEDARFTVYEDEERI